MAAGKKAYIITKCAARIHKAATHAILQVKRRRELPERAAKKRVARHRHADVEAAEAAVPKLKDDTSAQQESSEEMQDLQQLLGSYREKFAGFEDAGLQDAKAKRKFKAKLQETETKLQKIERKLQEGEGQLQEGERQLEEERAKAAVLQMKLDEAEAASASFQPLSEDKIMLAAIELMHKSPAQRQRLMEIGGAFSN